MHALHNNLDQIFGLFFKVISLSMNSQANLLLQSVLNALVAFLGWVPHKYDK